MDDVAAENPTLALTSSSRVAVHGIMSITTHSHHRSFEPSTIPTIRRMEEKVILVIICFEVSEQCDVRSRTFSFVIGFLGRVRVCCVLLPPTTSSDLSCRSHSRPTSSEHLS